MKRKRKQDIVAAAEASLQAHTIVVSRRRFRSMAIDINLAFPHSGEAVTWVSGYKEEESSSSLLRHLPIYLEAEGNSFDDL